MRKLQMNAEVRGQKSEVRGQKLALLCVLAKGLSRRVGIRAEVLFSVFCFLSTLYCGLGYGDFWESLEDFYESRESGVGFAWLKLAPCARGVALGDAYLSVVEGATASWWNPAGLGRADGTQVNFTHWQHFMGVRYEFLGLSLKRGRDAYGVGFGGVFINEIEHRNEQQELQGEYSAYDFLASFSYARLLEKGLYFGGSIKGIYERIYIYELSSWLLDFGVIYTPYPDMWIGGTLVNLGPSPSLMSEKIKPPRGWKLGVSYKAKELLWSCDINKYIDAVLGTGIGVEYGLGSFFCVRAGYRTGSSTYCLSAGFGIKFKGFEFDYAFKPYELGLGSAHIFTVAR